MAAPKTIPFLIANAFTSDRYAGNPAAVVFTTPELDLSDDTMNKIARNFNQTMTAFVAGGTVEGDEASFDIKWFNGTQEWAICGHATIAALKAIRSTEGMVPASIKTYRFRRRAGSDLTIVVLVEDEQFEMTIPATEVTEITGEEASRLRAIYERAFGKQLSVRFIGRGGPGFDSYVIIDIDTQDPLADYQVNIEVLRETGHLCNVFTSESLDPGTAFVSRNFAPLAGLPEDHVSGSTNSLLAPYWSKRKGLGASLMPAKQVSPRGGDVGVTWNESERTVHLKAHAVLVAGGELYL
ncbi:Diaminopimelate epimerase-like protein [Heliocybe sulcata]|uniref:Diaminopimelate epimerase-like protein n=1 Tax=Heliocybe sulcata TaxID=5364 RepID=A0A5C3N745_9AGAM|nr:Diaminopimelate epimerase-like protein [Heliocybe sulcata]